MRIRIYFDAVLREKAKEIENIDGNLIYVINEMKYLAKENNAIGIASVQLGVLQRIIIIIDKERIITILNPVVVEKSNVSEIMDEGCLSLPNFEVKIERPNRVIVKGINENGKDVIYEFKNILARASLHEIDHLDGKLIIDYLPPKERAVFEIFWRKNEKKYSPKII